MLGFKEKGTVALLGNLNARIGRSAAVDDVIGVHIILVGIDWFPSSVK